MNDKDNHIIYTAADIEKYLSGKLTPLQMHAMEKAALDDEFLADAIEGYGLVNQEDWKKELAGLQTKFQNSSTAKIIALPSRKRNNWWKAVAAILLIGTTATLSYLALNNKENIKIAQQTASETQPAAAVEAKDSNEVAETVSNTAKEAGESTKAEKKQVTSTASNAPENRDMAITETIRPDSSFVYTPAKEVAAPVKNYKAEQKSAEDEFAKSQKPVAQTTNATAGNVYNNNSNVAPDVRRMANTRQAENGMVSVDKDQSAFLKKQQTPELTRYFSAQVLAPDNTPLPFANVTIKNENFGTYADVKGNFRLVSADSVLTVEVKAAGYQPQFYTLQSYIAQNKIVLKEEDVSLRYRAVTANPATVKSKASRKATLLKDSVVNVEPADGWENYNTYVNNNIEIPDDILDKNLHGQVQLSFDIKPNGTISNIKVDKSLCNDCDEAAKRLLEQGPQWKTKNGKKGKGKVVVQF
jgi:CarboxypepD_reg-like domain/Gram-negative bacterial TonB protein C-terminal